MSDDIDPTAAEAAAKLADATKALKETQDKIAALEKERDAFKAKFEDAKTTRDKAKAQEREEAEKKGEYEKVIAGLHDELATLKTTVAEVESLKQIKSDYDALQEKIRTDLIAKLPEASREKYKEFSIAQLEVVISDLPEAHRVPVDGSKRGGGNLESKPWKEMTFAEKTDAARKAGLNTPGEVTEYVARRERTGI